jgi:CDP-diacylglycerol pyrophosphatase
MGLAINSARDTDRTVDQLHIHVSCIKSSVYKKILHLEAAADVKNPGSSVELCGSHYWVTYQESLDPDPFDAVGRIPEAPDNWTADKCFYGSRSVVVAAAEPAGYYILVGEDEKSGHGEKLLDESCSS